MAEREWEMASKVDETTGTRTDEAMEGGGVSRREFLGQAAMGTAAVVGMGAAGAMAQTRTEGEKGRGDGSASNPGPKNSVLMGINPDSNMPPVTDKGNPPPSWYSFDLTHRRVQGGGWTHQVTERELTPSKELAGVNMRLTAGSFRELHWHVADEWSIMLSGKARVTLMQPDGKMFVDDIQAGDLWYFPAGYPHSIQGLEGDGCEFLLVFDQGNFSEDDTFLLSEFLAHTPPDVVEKNMGWSRGEWDKLPPTELYIFEAELPDSLEADKRFLGENLETERSYTFKMSTMKPTEQTAGGAVHIADSSNFPVAQNIAMAMVTIKPGGMREMHWHPNASEWQYWIKGEGRMTVVQTGGKARTVNFRANDVGYVPVMAGHYIENTGTEDLVFLEMFKSARYQDVSLNQWIARMPDKMAMAHTKLPKAVIRRAPQGRNVVLPG